MAERAWSSPHLLAVAKETRKRVLRVRFRREVEPKGSKGATLKAFRTLARSQEGDLEAWRGL